ncbi:MAG: tRNA epoxyqueuosine(34) reductase QueG [Vulcanimicrobiaceae bacterium]
MQTARDAGAGSVRICDAVADAIVADRFDHAVERGDLATWPYDRAYAARAAAPQALFGSARAVVCIAVPYAAPPPPVDRPLVGRVSNYAWSGDYHAVVRRICERIVTVLDDAAPPARSRIVCDTAPLAERAFAARAGLGWIGKHTNVIAPNLGSYIFLGEVVTSAALPVDPPLRKECGSCTRCVDVCPTGALRGDYTIDATRCISDLTQRTDAIPRTLRPLMGTWVWGCDLCQAVCPPTRNAAIAPHPAFANPASSAAFPDLVGLLELRSAEFKRRYRSTAMGWRGGAVLRRNAAVALGNTGDPLAVDPLERALAADPHPLVRGHAAWALGRIGSPKALAALRRAADMADRDPKVRAEIAAALEPPPA